MVSTRGRRAEGKIIRVAVKGKHLPDQTVKKTEEGGPGGVVEGKIRGVNKRH